MHTPSLRRRVVLSGIAVFAGLLVASDIFVFLTLRSGLEATLEEVVGTRAELASKFAAVMGPDELAEQLTAAGVPVVVTTAEGRVIEAAPAVPRFQQGPPGPSGSVKYPRVSAIVALPGGGSAEVFATRAGVDTTLERTGRLLLVGTVLALAAAVLLLRRSTTAAIAPLELVADKARLTAAGNPGERLKPDDPDSELGRMAVAYDHMLDSLESALEQARLAEERTRRFLDDAAHQLRTPIAGVRASVESLLGATDAQEHDRLMTNLIRETGRSSRILQDLLTIARLDNGEVPHRGHADLVAMVRDEADRATSLAPHLQIVVLDAAPLPPVLLDERLVQDAIANLLDNARRHANGQVEVSVIGCEGYIEVIVRDDGEGLATGTHDLVFERFVSLSSEGGAGLGLPIARLIARSHGGDVSYQDGAFVLRIAAVDEPVLDRSPS